MRRQTQLAELIMGAGLVGGGGGAKAGGGRPSSGSGMVPAAASAQSIHSLPFQPQPHRYAHRSSIDGASNSSAVRIDPNELDSFRRRKLTASQHNLCLPLQAASSGHTPVAQELGGPQRPISNSEGQGEWGGGGQASSTGATGTR
jgi:hypothetical protein